MAEPYEVRSARGHVAHLERLVQQWTHRRDVGDAVPSAETLTKWMKQAEADLKQARAVLKNLTGEES